MPGGCLLRSLAAASTSTQYGGDAGEIAKKRCRTRRKLVRRPTIDGVDDEARGLVGQEARKGHRRSRRPATISVRCLARHGGDCGGVGVTEI